MINNNNKPDLLYPSDIINNSISNKQKVMSNNK